MNIRQCEIWMVAFDPSVGSEIQKIQPAVVINYDAMGRLGLRTIVPITGWKDDYKEFPWIIKLEKSKENGLSKTSTLECYQVKNFSQKRFVKKIGVIDSELLLQIHKAILKTFNPTYQIK